MKKIEPITPQSFRPYGKVIAYPNRHTKGKTRNLWRILHTEGKKVGWRIAYLVLRDKTIGRLERHPTSDETFEPLKGRALLFASKTQNMSDIRCFLLDQPIIIHKNIWHGVIALDDEVDIKIMENADVSCQYWPFGFRVNAQNWPTKLV